MARKSKEQIERDEQIYQLSTLVAGEFSLQEVLDRLAEAAVKITGVKACSIRLLDPQTGSAKSIATRAWCLKKTPLSRRRLRVKR